ncbi:hypothetical protein TcasGA2_TC034219 [Tribolium castaneum]|uniref:Uncharacterized protein n=1 Tax=Tribolium castaneum TaxID=7070 RepID=A0A139WNW7_TRICA|nr:hypothetical protein TcasGA2_TC034219 [Tribolium castaneum]
MSLVQVASDKTKSCTRSSAHPTATVTTSTTTSTRSTVLRQPSRVTYIHRTEGLTFCLGPICPGCGSGRPEPLSQSTPSRCSVVTVKLTFVAR